MKNSTRLRLTAAGLTLGIVGASAGAAMADGSSTEPVTVNALSGTRTLQLLDPTGAKLSGLSIGNGEVGGFLTNVTDLNYSNVGYQVTAEMSNLYPYSAGNYDFASTDIPSSALSLSFPSNNPVDLTGVGTVVAPVVTLTGDLSSLTGPLLTQLGVGSLSANGITTTLDTTLAGEPTTVTNLTSEILNGAANDLPIQLQAGDAGSFASSGPLTGVTGAPAASNTPTQLLLMQGSPNGVSGLLADLQSQLGTVNLSTLISNNIITQSQAVNAIESATSLPPSFVTANLNSILSLVTAKLTSITGLLGQTGSYSSLPVLNVAIPKDTAGGTYKGVMTVTLMDTPSS